jgi:hypothetical protein
MSKYKGFYVYKSNWSHSVVVLFPQWVLRIEPYLSTVHVDHEYKMGLKPNFKKNLISTFMVLISGWNRTCGANWEDFFFFFFFHFSSHSGKLTFSKLHAVKTQDIILLNYKVYVKA